jgi:hypothetical protein
VFSIGKKNRQDASLLSRRLASAEITRKSRGYFGVLSVTKILRQYRSPFYSQVFRYQTISASLLALRILWTRCWRRAAQLIGTSDLEAPPSDGLKSTSNNTPRY